jgi:hypothetical protein
VNYDTKEPRPALDFSGRQVNVLSLLIIGEAALVCQPSITGEVVSRPRSGFHKRQSKSKGGHDRMEATSGDLST